MCYFLKLPKSLLRFSFFNKTPLHRQLKSYRQCLFSTYMAIQKVYLIYVLSIGSFFLHPFFWRRGGGNVISINLGYKREPPPKIISNEEGCHHILQELSVKFTNTPPPSLLPPLLGRLSKGVSKQHMAVDLPKFSGKLTN